MTFFPNYSYEQYYQAVRRCWRFGQKNKVQADLIYTRGDTNTILSLKRKQIQADEMFDNLVNEMYSALDISSLTKFEKQTEVPEWL
jgi:hypothetical protein